VGGGVGGAFVNPNLLFKLANNAALIGWILLIFLPRWRWSARLIAPVLVPALLAALYSWLVVTQFGHSPGGFSSLTSVALLFQNRAMLLAGWVHYLAFDLFVGSWEVRDSQAAGIRHYLVVPCLILTFLFGPAGWFLYFLIRSTANRSGVIESAEEAALSAPHNDIRDYMISDRPIATANWSAKAPINQSMSFAIGVPSGPVSGTSIHEQRKQTQPRCP
jgi:hypothetical protein